MMRRLGRLWSVPLPVWLVGWFVLFYAVGVTGEHFGDAIWPWWANAGWALLLAVLMTTMMACFRTSFRARARIQVAIDEARSRSRLTGRVK